MWALSKLPEQQVELYSYALRLEDQSFAPLLIISAEDWGKKRTHFLEDVPVLLGSKIHQKSMELDVQFAKKLRLSPGEIPRECGYYFTTCTILYLPCTPTRSRRRDRFALGLPTKPHEWGEVQGRGPGVACRSPAGLAGTGDPGGGGFR